MIIKLVNRSHFFKFYCQVNMSSGGASVSPTLSYGQSFSFDFSNPQLIIDIGFRMTYGGKTLSFDNIPVERKSTSYALSGGPVWPLLIINHSVARD